MQWRLSYSPQLAIKQMSHNPAFEIQPTFKTQTSKQSPNQSN